MRILLVGDIFGECGMEYIRYTLKDIAVRENIDVVIANGENASGGNGLSYSDYDTLMDIGVDVVTMGNHTFGRKDILKILEATMCPDSCIDTASSVKYVNLFPDTSNEKIIKRENTPEPNCCCVLTILEQNFSNGIRMTRNFWEIMRVIAGTAY